MAAGVALALVVLRQPRRRAPRLRPAARDYGQRCNPGINETAATRSATMAAAPATNHHHYSPPFRPTATPSFRFPQRPPQRKTALAPFPRGERFERPRTVLALKAASVAAKDHPLEPFGASPTVRDGGP